MHEHKDVYVGGPQYLQHVRYVYHFFSRRNCADSVLRFSYSRHMLDWDLQACFRLGEATLSEVVFREHIGYLRDKKIQVVVEQSMHILV